MLPVLHGHEDATLCIVHSEARRDEELNVFRSYLSRAVFVCEYCGSMVADGGGGLVGLWCCRCCMAVKVQPFA